MLNYYYHFNYYFFRFKPKLKYFYSLIGLNFSFEIVTLIEADFYILVYLIDFIFFSTVLTVFSGIKSLSDFSIQSDDYIAPQYQDKYVKKF